MCATDTGVRALALPLCCLVFMWNLIKLFNMCAINTHKKHALQKKNHPKTRSETETAKQSLIYKCFSMRFPVFSRHIFLLFFGIFPLFLSFSLHVEYRHIDTHSLITIYYYPLKTPYDKHNDLSILFQFDFTRDSVCVCVYFSEMV